YRAEAYQISKTIGMLSVVLGGRYDAIILTGGMAYSKMLTDWIQESVGFIAPVVVMAGENEMDALAQGGLRILTGQEQANVYHFPERK
ncbi:MAG: butyrate kinase, partial [Bacteroidales bacterium]|nr:butyrate kinase [Bacteroidales bacterium]